MRWAATCMCCAAFAVLRHTWQRLSRPGRSAGAASGQGPEDPLARLFVAFRLQRKRALKAVQARLAVALQEDAALAELESLEAAAADEGVALDAEDDGTDEL